MAINLINDTMVVQVMDVLGPSLWDVWNNNAHRYALLHGAFYLCYSMQLV